MTTPPNSPLRTVHVLDRQEFGSDTQVDRKAMLLVPGPAVSPDPFLLLAEDWFGDAGFDWHPHRGVETITFVVEGELEHRDNAGGKGLLGPNDVQWMTAGRGIIHRELAAGRRFAHTLQLWLNLPSHAKMTPPSYQDLRAADMPVGTAPGVEVRVYSGRSHGVEGPARNLVSTTFFDATVAPGACFAHPVANDDWGFAYVLSGAGAFGQGKAAVAGQIVHLSPAGDPGEALLIANAGDEGLRFLFWAARPLREPVVSRGPFVMNTEAEIRQAWADYHAGRFGSVPRI
jgi:redox-sensitive bicupin YhaK (pirin superfamily)